MKTSSTNELMGSSSFNSFLTNMQVTVDNYPPKKLDDDVLETGRLIKVSRLRRKLVSLLGNAYLGKILS